MFTALVYRYPVLHTRPIFALIITVIVIGFINFGFTKYFAFKKRSIDEFSLFNSHQAT